MKRSDFLKRLGIGIGAVVVAPRVLAEMPAKEEKLTYTLNPNNYEPKKNGYYLYNWNQSMEVPKGWRVPVPKDIIEMYKQAGVSPFYD